MLSIGQCYLDFVDKILKEGKETYKDSDHHLKESLGNYYYIDDPLDLKFRAKYQHMTPELMLEEIKSGKASSGYGQPSGSYGGSPYTGYSHYSQYSYTDEDRARLSDVKSYINRGLYDEALSLLAMFNVRDAEWFHLSAVSNYHIGNTITAIRHARQAVMLDPSNTEYRETYFEIASAGDEYGGWQSAGGIDIGGMGQYCSTMFAGMMLCYCLSNCCG